MDKNWIKLIEEYEPSIESKYVDREGQEYIFIGLLHGSDDYYFVMQCNGVVRLLSCVETLEQMGFKQQTQEGKA